MVVNCPIAIRQVGNGFIVEPVSECHATVWSADQTMVFQTLTALKDWLSAHFPEKELTGTTFGITK